MSADFDWEQAMALYEELTSAEFNLRYPGWYNDEAFMERLREEFGKAAEVEKSA